MCVASLESRETHRKINNHTNPLFDLEQRQRNAFRKLAPPPMLPSSSMGMVVMDDDDNDADDVPSDSGDRG